MGELKSGTRADRTLVETSRASAGAPRPRIRTRFAGNSPSLRPRGSPRHRFRTARRSPVDHTRNGIEPGQKLLDVVLVTGVHKVYYESLTLDGSVDDSDNLVALVTDAADINGDGQVDLADHAKLESCLTGPGGSIAATYSLADLDFDDDVDLDDFAVFQPAFRRPF